MAKTLHNQITALRQMTPGQLRERYTELFGEAPRSGNRDQLAKRLAWRIQSLAEGGLSERAQRRADELARDADIRVTVPRIPTNTAQGSTAPMRTGASVPIPGTILTRQYKGRLIQVTVLPDGFDYEGEVYKSLSAIAKLITGTHWNGHVFFGLRNGKNL